MKQLKFIPLVIGAAALMQLALSAKAGTVQSLPPLQGVKIGKIQYLSSETSKDAKLERAILRTMPDYKESVSNLDQYVRYYYNRVDLNGDGQREVVVYLVGAYSCGSGGCTTLIFTPSKQDYRLVSTLTLVNEPILVTPQKNSGWNDLVIWVRGGGIKGKYTRVRFNGRAYPSNPSVQPAVSPKTTLTGQALVADASSSPGSVLRP